MNWIRMATTMKGDPKVHAIALACCKGDVAKAIGHLQCLFSELPAHAADGSLKGVSPLTLEQWSLWTGKRGVFDSAIRTTLCDDDTITGWEKYNGAAIRSAEHNRHRQQRFRDRANTERQEYALRGELRNGVTERNGTERKNNSSSTAILESERALFLHQPPRGAA